MLNETLFFIFWIIDTIKRRKRSKLYYIDRLLPRMMILTSGTGLKAQGKSLFPAGKPRNWWKTEALLRAGRSRNYPATSSRFPSERTGIWPAGTGKISGSEYCFHEIAGIPRKRLFPCRTVWPGYNLNIKHESIEIIFQCDWSLFDMTIFQYYMVNKISFIFF